MKQIIIMLVAIFLFIMGIGIQAQQTNISSGGTASGSGCIASYTAGQQKYNSFLSAGDSVNRGVQHQQQAFFGTNYIYKISTTNISICPSQLPYSWNGLTFTKLKQA
jgi:hypothetical protein